MDFFLIFCFCIFLVADVPKAIVVAGVLIKKVVVTGVLARTKTSSNALDASKLQSSVALVAQQHAGVMNMNQICEKNSE